MRVHSIKGDAHGGEIRALQGQSPRVPVPLKVANGEILASRDGYKSKANAQQWIESVGANATGAAVV